MKRSIRGIEFGHDAQRGEIVEARKSAASPYTRALVFQRSERFDGRIRYDFIWLESNSGTRTPVVAGTRGSVVTVGFPPLIRRIEESGGAAG